MCLRWLKVTAALVIVDVVASFRLQVNTSGKVNCGGLIPGGRAEFKPFDAYSNVGKKCGRCLDEHECKWCQLSQRCIHSGSWIKGGESCSYRKGKKVSDGKVKRKTQCTAHADNRGEMKAPWIRMMEEAYGVDWNKDQNKHMDAVRCIEWTLGWPLTPAREMNGWPEKEIGRWSCNSALMRDGFLASLLKISLRKSASQPDPFGARLISQQKFYAGAVTWDPLLCGVIQVKDKNVCYVRGFALNEFMALRNVSQYDYSRWQRSNDHRRPADITQGLVESLDSGPLLILQSDASGGKKAPKSGIATTYDGKYRVQFGLEHTASTNEPANMLSLIMGDKEKNLRSLADHMGNFSTSYLNRYYAMIKVRSAKERTYAVLMDHPYYRLDRMADQLQKIRQDIWFTRYELKGEMNLLSQRPGDGHGSYTVYRNPDFQSSSREHGHLQLEEGQCMQFRQSLEADVNFLAAHDMWDYSLSLLAIKRPARRASEKGKDRFGPNNDMMCSDLTPGEPFCLETGQRMYTFSITDYLRSFKNESKEVSQSVFSSKSDKYGQQIKINSEQMCPAQDTRAFIRKLQQLLDLYGGSIEAWFKRIDVNGGGSISEMEMRNYMEKQHMKPSEIKKVFAVVDDRFDITIDSFRDMLTSVMGEEATAQPDASKAVIRNSAAIGTKPIHQVGGRDDRSGATRKVHFSVFACVAHALPVITLSLLIM